MATVIAWQELASSFRQTYRFPVRASHNLATDIAWRELASSFRQTYIFPKNAHHSWFPGHMGKSLKVMQRKLTDVDCVIEVHDARIPLSGRNRRFRDSITGVRPHVLVLNKKDLVMDDDPREVAAAVKANDPDVSRVIYTNCHDFHCPGVGEVLPTALELIREGNRYHRTERPDKSILVIGIPNVGKSTLINKLRQRNLRVGGRPAPVGAKPGITKAVQERIRVSDNPLVFLMDTPGIMMPYIRDMHMGMKLAMCATLQDHLLGEVTITDYMLWWLNTHNNFQYVDYMKLQQPMENVKIMLAHAALAEGWYRKKTVIDPSDNIREVPDLKKAAEKFIKGFRKGQFGRINLDCDDITLLSRKKDINSHRAFRTR